MCKQSGYLIIIITHHYYRFEVSYCCFDRNEKGGFVQRNITVPTTGRLKHLLHTIITRVHVKLHFDVCIFLILFEQEHNTGTTK